LAVLPYLDHGEDDGTADCEPTQYLCCLGQRIKHDSAFLAN
jgi:hypothetical protein